MMQNLTSTQNLLVKHWTKLRKDRAFREEQKTVLISGRKLINEIGVEYPLKRLLVSNEDLIPKQAPHKETYLVSEEIIKKVTGLLTPEGIAAEVSMPPWHTLDQATRVVVFDGVRDPGNLGTLLRTALAFGWDGAFFLKNSCDPYNDKALRAAKGATFRLPLRTGTVNELEQFIQNNNFLAFAADIKGIPLPEFTADKSKVLLVLGNEGVGLSSEIGELCQKVTIPINAEVESLNVATAGAILMHSFRATGF